MNIEDLLRSLDIKVSALEKRQVRIVGRLIGIMLKIAKKDESFTGYSDTQILILMRNVIDNKIKRKNALLSTSMGKKEKANEY